MTLKVLPFLLFLSISGFAQEVKYKYDAIGRLIELSYPNQSKVNYTYDKDGNRIQKAETVVIVITTNIKHLEDPRNLLVLFPNPTEGPMNGRIFIDKEQDVIVSVYSTSGAIIHTYTFHATIGEWQFKMDIFPITEGTYQVQVKGKDFDSTQKIVVRY